jgi:hypothetical protein
VGQAVRRAYGAPPTLCVLLCLLLCSVEKPTVLQAEKAARTAARAAARDAKAAAQPENRYTKSVQSAQHLNAFVLQMSEADQGAKHLTGALSAARNVQVGSPFPRTPLVQSAAPDGFAGAGHRNRLRPLSEKSSHWQARSTHRSTSEPAMAGRRSRQSSGTVSRRDARESRCSASSRLSCSPMLTGSSLEGRRLAYQPRYTSGRRWTSGLPTKPPRTDER